MFPIRTHRSIGALSSASGVASAILRARAAEWEIELVETDEALVLHVWNSELRLIPENGAVRLELAAPEARLIGYLQDSTTELFESHGLSIQWDHVDQGALAPGLSLMRVVSIQQRTPGFIRVRLAGDDAQRFAQGGLHFRLLIPPQGRVPQWPRVAENGRTRWPEGADALHRPVYTFTGQQADWIEFDIFRHSGSPTCDWADRSRPGDVVGVIGPGGGWCPEGGPLWLYGDQTALPAIARMLDLAVDPVQVFLRCAPRDMGPLCADPRVTPCDDLLAALDQADPATTGHIWFAGPASEAREARKRLTARGINKRQFTAAAYWGQPDSPA